MNQGHSRSKRPRGGTAGRSTRSGRRAGGLSARASFRKTDALSFARQGGRVTSMRSFRAVHRTSHRASLRSSYQASRRSPLDSSRTRPSRHTRQLRLPLHMKAAAIVTACNEEKTISRVLSELRRLPLQDIIVVLNGCTDRTYEKAIEHPGVTVVHIPERLGYDVGRSIGARLTTADIVLFTDADIPLRAEELAPFLLAVQRGTDVALNHLTPLIPVFEQQDQVTRCKVFLNRMLKRTDLGADSMTAIPHALSRRCLDAVGTDVLAVPPLAQARAIMKEMRTAGVCTVNVLARNRRRASMNRGTGNPVEQLIIGDHAEALSAILNAPHESSSRTSPSRAKIAEGRNRYTPHKHHHSHV